MFEHPEEMRFEIVKLLLNDFMSRAHVDEERTIEGVIEEARKVEGYLLEDEKASS